jgi:hypothetical protein
LKILIFSPLRVSIRVARTTAPSTSGAPTVTSPASPSISTWSKAISAPGAPSSFSTTSRSPALTRYCFPPVLITAYMGGLRNEWMRTRSVSRRRRSARF